MKKVNGPRKDGTWIDNRGDKKWKHTNRFYILEQSFYLDLPLTQL